MILNFLYLVKTDYYSAQQEYRLGVNFDNPLINNDELKIPTTGLEKYVKIHDPKEIYTLKLRYL